MTKFAEKIAGVEAYRDIYERLNWLLDEYQSQIETQAAYTDDPERWNYQMALDTIASVGVKKDVVEGMMKDIIKKL